MADSAGKASALEVGQSIFNLGSTLYTNYRNQANIEKQWAREDNAVQRRAADMKAAGLSKTLAAGNAASSSAPMRMEAPQVKMDPFVKGQQVELNRMGLRSAEQQLMEQRANISRTAAQEALIRAQEEKVRQDIDFGSDMNPLKIEEKRWSNLFKSSTFDMRVQELKENLTIAQLKQKNIEADTALKGKQQSRLEAQTLLDTAQKGLALAQEARLSGLARINKERWEKDIQPGGKYESESEMLATNLAMKQIVLKRMLAAEGVKGYLGEKIKEGWEWFIGE